MGRNKKITEIKSWRNEDQGQDYKGNCTKPIRVQSSYGKKRETSPNAKEAIAKVATKKSTEELSTILRTEL